MNVNATLAVDVVGAKPQPAVADNVDMLSFQKLRVYQRSIEFLAVALEIIAELPKGHAELADQLLRAAQSQRTQVPSMMLSTLSPTSGIYATGERRARRET